MSMSNIKIHLGIFDYPQDVLNEMQKHLDEMPEDCKNIRYWYDFSTRNIYFAYEEDAVVFKLKFGL